mgnify:CR=1 FL=1
MEEEGKGGKEDEVEAEAAKMTMSQGKDCI